MPSKRASARSASPSEHLALRYYRLGCRLLERDVVSDKEFERLAANLGLRAGADAWYKAIRLAKLFKPDESELENLCRLRENGRQIAWSHMVELMRLSTAKKREHFAERAARLSLGIDSLRGEIREENGWKSERDGAGRGRRLPHTVSDAIWRASREIEQLKVTLVWLKDKGKPTKPTTLRRKLPGTLAALEALQKTIDRFVGTKKHPAPVTVARQRNRRSGEPT